MGVLASGRVRTSVEISPEADDMRLWMAIVRYGQSLNQVIESAIRDRAYSAGYDPHWIENPRNQELAREWARVHVRRPRTTPLLGGILLEQEHHEEEQEQDRHVEDEEEKERILVNA